MEKKKKSSIFCCSSSASRKRINKGEKKDDKIDSGKNSSHKDKISSISSSDNLPDNLENKSENSNKENLKEINKIPKNRKIKYSSNISDMTNKSISNVMTKTITPLIPEKNSLPDSDLNKSNEGKLGENPTQNTENKEIKLNLTNRFDEAAEGEFKLITTETEKIEASDLDDSCTVRKETNPARSSVIEIKNFCDPVMFQSNSTPKEMFSLREGVDFTFKKSINTENKSELLLSTNNKLNPYNEISEYINYRDSFRLSVIDNDNNNKSPVNSSKTVKNPFNNFNKNTNINKLELSIQSNKEENHNKTEEEIKLKEDDEVNTYIKSQFNINLVNCGENANTRRTAEEPISIKESINLNNDELSLYTKIKNINSITNKRINYANIDIDADELTLKNSFVSQNDMPFTSQIYSNLIKNNKIVKKDDDLSSKSKRNDVKIDDIISNFNKSIANQNNISITSCNFTNNINHISLSNCKELQPINDGNSKNKDERFIDIASYDNKSFNPSLDNSSLKYTGKNENENHVLNITEDNIEAEEELNERESCGKSDNQSVISSKIMSHINTPKMLSYVKTSTEQSFALSNFTKSDIFHTFDKYQVSSSCNNSKLNQENEDFEYEIMNENLDGYNKFIDTPKSSNLYIPILKNNTGSSDKSDPLHKNIASSYNFNHPQLKELNERLSRKEKEMKKVNEKIQQVMSDLLKYEEENKKQERKIEKEEAEAQMLRNFLNFLTTQG